MQPQDSGGCQITHLGCHGLGAEVVGDCGGAVGVDAGVDRLRDVLLHFLRELHTRLYTQISERVHDTETLHSDAATDQFRRKLAWKLTRPTSFVSKRP